MYPVRFQVIDEKRRRAQSPGEGIRPKDDAYAGDKMHGDGNIDDTKETPAGEHDKHGHVGLARAAANARNAVGKGQQTIEE